MKRTFLALHFEGGAVHEFELLDGYYVIGGDAAANLRIDLPTVAPRHLALAIVWGKVQVEPFVQGIVVNGYEIAERVEVELPASVEFPGVGMLLRHEEVEAEDPDKTIPFARKPSAQSLDPDKTITVARPREAAPVDPDATIVRPRQPGGANFGGTGGEGFAPLQGGFRLGNEIARGGMGRIHVGEDFQLKRQVAIKISHDSGVDPRFSREAEVLARLAHPNIVPVIALGVDNEGRPYYAMKLVKGRTLQAVLKSLREGDAQAAKEFSLPNLLTIFRKVCDAVAFAHSQKILHRDLKPENIMVGEYGEVLVMDWGLAKILGDPMAETGERKSERQPAVEESGDFGRTLDGDVMGSPYYMSPEQAMGKVNLLDERSDIYSLGGILYALLTLRPPLDGKSVAEILTKVKNGEITPMTTTRRGRTKREPGEPATMGRQIPEALQAVTKKAMARFPDKRYGRVEELAKDIEAYQSGYATKAENASALRQIQLLVKRHKTVSALLALFFVAMVGFTLKVMASERAAVAASEATRREVAKALISAAEAAEDAKDPEAMRDSLAKVPEDLRDSTWAYLQHKSNEVDLKITMPGGGGFLSSISAYPGKPNAFLVTQHTGEISQVDSDTGKVTQLWRVPPKKDYGLSNAIVFPDGKRAALLLANNSGATIMMAKIEGGKWEAAANFSPIELPPGVSVLTLRISPTAVFVLDTTRKLSAYNPETGALAWEKPGIRFFTPVNNGLHVDAVTTEKQKMDRLLAQDGSLVAEGNVGMPGMGDGALVGGCVFVLSGDKVQLWKLENQSLLWEARFDKGKTSIRNACDHPRVGSLIQSSALGRNLEVWDTSGNLMRTCRFFSNDPRYSLAANGSTFAATENREIFLWRFLPTPCQMKLAVNGRDAAAPMAGGRRVLCFRDVFALYDSSNPQAGGKKISEEKSGLADGWLMGTDRKGERIAMVKNDSVAAFRFANDKLEEIYPPKKIDRVRGLTIHAFHPTEDLFWFADKVLEFSTGKEVASLDLQNNQVRDFIALNNLRSKSGVWVGSEHLVTPAVGSTQATGGSADQKMLVLWNAKTGVAEAKVSAPQVNSLEASPDGKWVVEGGVDKRIRIRNGKTLEIEREFRAHDGPVSGLAWHPRLPILATASGTSVRLWSTENWKMLEEIQLEEASRPPILDIPGEEGRRLFVWIEGRISIFEPKCFQKTP